MITRNNLSTQVGGDEKENNEEKLVRSFGLGGTCGLCFEHFRWSQPLSCRRGHCAMRSRYLQMHSTKCFATVIALVACAGQSFAGVCLKCEMTCDTPPGTVTTDTFSILGFPINTFETTVLASNPHKDCVLGAVWNWCTSSGSVDCLTTSKRTYSHLTGTWGPTTLSTSKTSTC
jgi:hypothetical protein